MSKYVGNRQTSKYVDPVVRAKTKSLFGPQEPPYAQQSFLPAQGGGQFPGGGIGGPPAGGNGLGGLFGGGSGGGSGGGLGNFNLGEMKQMIDRLGGIDGIMSTVTKLNKMMQTVQQMGPMLKLVAGTFLPKAATNDTDDDYSFGRRRRRRRKRRRINSRTRRAGRTRR